ncbi:MAG: hypothetical protein KDN20_04375 [Verrucomicrobiae bacterium]|nr:hypothetical protein [Verrucomicrobiae bacterium]
MNKKLILLLAAAVTTASLVSVSARTWTRSSDGATIEGEFVRVKDANTVYIARAGGATVEIPIAALSAEDQAFIKEKAAAAQPGSEEKKEAPKGETEVTLAGAHLCCGGCKTGVEDAVAGIKDLEVSMSGSNITVKGKSGNDVQKALDAIAAAGYYGNSDNETVKIADGKASDEETDSVKVSNVHLCCGKCVSAVDDVVKAITGASGHDAEKGSDSFTIKGEKIKPSAVLAALRAEGLNGTVK